MSSQQWFLWTMVVVVAVALDLGLVYLARWIWRRRRVATRVETNAVTVLGQYSPVLTWLRGRWLAVSGRRTAAGGAVEPGLPQATRDAAPRASAETPPDLAAPHPPKPVVSMVDPALPEAAPELAVPAVATAAGGKLESPDSPMLAPASGVPEAGAAPADMDLRAVEAPATSSGPQASDGDPQAAAAPKPPAVYVAAQPTPAPAATQALGPTGPAPAQAYTTVLQAGNLAHVSLTVRAPKGTTVRVMVEAVAADTPDVVTPAGSALPIRAPSPGAQPPPPKPRRAWQPELRAAWRRLEGWIGAGAAAEGLAGAGGLSSSPLADETAIGLPSKLAARLKVRTLSLESTLFALGLAVFALTRLWGIDRFPIFFYSDEANNVLFGQAVVANGLRDSEGAWLPLYFEWDSGRWAPVLPVYVHALTSTVFGKSIFVARATTAIVGLGAVLAVAYLLRLVFRVRFWWLAPWAMAAIPAYFLYGRTAFETVMATAFFGLFLLFYLRYRTGEPRFLWLAIIFGAAAFYSYSNMQLVLLALGGLLALRDLDYHRRHWAALRGALVLALAFAIPFVTFQLNHPGATASHLAAIHSYWVEPLPLTAKVGQFVATYAHGLSPRYWFWPNPAEAGELPNQHMPGAGHFWVAMLPLILIGAWLCARQWRSPGHRTVLLAVLAMPIGAALDSIEIARVLAMVVPFSILLGLGLDWLLNRLPRLSYRTVAVAGLTLFALVDVGMLAVGLLRGPTWSTDYGLYGMQYGVKQLYEEVLPGYLRREPNLKIVISSTWLNNAPLFPDFFFTADERARVEIGMIDNFLRDKLPVADTLLVMTATEYGRANASGKFETIEVAQVIDYPSGAPGFYLARLSYVQNIDEIFAAEHEAELKPVEDNVVVAGQTLVVIHSRLSDGQVGALFDGNPDTLIRGAAANPFVLEVRFPAARPLQAFDLTVGSMDDFVVSAQAQTESGDTLTTSMHYVNLPADPTVTLALADAPATVTSLHLEIKFNNGTDQAQIHLRELGLR